MNSFIDHFNIARLPAAAEAFRVEVRDFLAAEAPSAPADARARSWVAADPAFSRKLAQRGWVGVTLPKAYGGAELDAFHRFVLVEELLASGAPVAAHWVADRQSGPLILRFGSPFQKDFYLPKITTGEAFFCIGMSEPNSGSDLASVRTRATKVDGGWKLKGSKIWTTNAHHCRYMIALVRSSGTVEDRQKGLSQFIVDLQLPGVVVRTIEDMTGDAHFCEVLFDDVLLSDDALVGAEGGGWSQVNAELAFERSGPERLYSSVVLIDCWIEKLRARGTLDAHVETIGRFATQLTALREMSLSVTARLAAGETPLVEAAVVKDAGTEFEQMVPAIIEGLLGSDPADQLDDELVRACAYLSQFSPTFSLRGGTREILRGMIARGLGLR